MNDPTPCDEFTVHDVVDHMIVAGTTFAHLFRGQPAPEISPPAVYGWVPVREFTEAMDQLSEAVASPGALDRTLEAPPGEMSGDAFARFVAFDGLVHGWDLAQASGQDYDPDVDVVAAVEDFIRDALPTHLRDGDTFAAATDPPAAATPLQRVVAFSGRAI